MTLLPSSMMVQRVQLRLAQHMVHDFLLMVMIVRDVCLSLSMDGRLLSVQADEQAARWHLQRPSEENAGQVPARREALQRSSSLLVLTL